MTGNEKKIIVLLVTAFMLFSGVVLLNDRFTGEASGTNWNGDSVDNETWSGTNYIDGHYNVSDRHT